MDIKVLGTGCAKCKNLEKIVREVVSDMGISANVEKVTEINKIMEYDILMTPGLVINGAVKVAGKVPGKDELKKIIENEM
ncbi:thioredoxin family protein [Herbivorax sp. ANBcel31]|uniref:thioredoxin family protein n=1 Tax=Herbivorax sp. ANBcel31 TaxID=3069754 RepID=UPI0027B22EF0|nr:thioredoxin family protein [Herbivorax sp. ANBcel31]MDQ2087797.1 thioredoxin family protein [Herbivorax sp. ANBcel31]